MYKSGLKAVHTAYVDGRNALIDEPRRLTDLEEVVTKSVAAIIEGFITEAASEYDAASLLYPFWKNYPPESRGRQPIGDQFPWIEVGEHTVGTKLARQIQDKFEVSDLGFPTGADQRFVIKGEEISKATAGLTDCAWLCVDIKSVGPRDDQRHAVMSHNQISGSGEWIVPENGVLNASMTAIGRKSSHIFYPALPPLIVLPSGAIAPTLTLAVKPVYGMQPWQDGDWSGQPLHRLELIAIPNGLLLTRSPGYLAQYPGLLFPGKDDKKKNELKVRARVSFDLLTKIAPWRVRTVWARNGAHP